MGDAMRQWLETATAQLRYRRAAPGVARELESHLNEQYHAYLAQGCTPGEAEKKTVASMGDPVLAGGALDLAHRPRPAWGPFCAAALLFLASGLLHWWESASLAADGTRLWRADAHGALFSAVLSVLTLALAQFCLDVSRLARRAWQLYGLLLVLSAGGFFLWPAILNGRRYGSLPGLGLYSAFDFALLFLPVWAAVVYRQRGRGWRGFFTGALALVPGGLLCLCAPQLSAAASVAAAGLALAALCCRADWFGVGRKRGILALLGLGAAPVLLVLLLTAPRLGQFLARYSASLSDPLASGYWPNGLRRMWDGMRWFAPGDETLLLSEATGLVRVEDFVRRGASALRADFLLPYLGWRYGAFWALLAAVAVGGALAWLWRTALRTRSCAGRLCAVSVCALLTASGALYLCVCFGILPTSELLLPFWGSGVDRVIQAAVVGLLLSAFRLDNVLREPSAAPRPAPDTV